MKDYSTPYSRAIDSNGVRLPAILCQIRTEQGRQLRRQGVERFKYKFLTPRTDGIVNTISTVQKDNLLMEEQKNNSERLSYKEHPTKYDLLAYFSSRIRIRKLTERECFRLMDVDDSDIDKINCYPFNSRQERETAIESADRKQLKAIKDETISKTAKLKMAGNSIVVSCLY